MSWRVLVVDDERLIRWALREKLTGEGYEVVEAVDGKEAERAVESGSFDCVLLDLRLPDTDGVALLRKMHRTRPELPVILVTAYSSIDSAVEAMKCGAVDYVSKPFNMDEIAATVRHAIEAGAARRQHLSAPAGDEKERFGLESIVGETAGMLQIKDLVQRVARSESTTILLLGESGTGKDMIARAIMSFPVPLSPKSRIVVDSLLATRCTRSLICSIPAVSPTMLSSPNRSFSSLADAERCWRRAAPASMAWRTVAAISSILNGLLT